MCGSSSCPNPNGVETITADILRADEVRKAATDADAVLMVVDSLYMYGPSSGPMTEDSPRRAGGPTGQLLACLEETFLAARTSGRVGVAIGRCSDFYGPHASSAANLLMIEPALRERRRPGSAHWMRLTPSATCRTLPAVW